jgi:hypothetical protein
MRWVAFMDSDYYITPLFLNQFLMIKNELINLKMICFIM